MADPRLPPELQLPPPRHPAGADRLLASNRKLVRGLFVGAAASVPGIVLVFWAQSLGTDESFLQDDLGTSLWIGLGLGAFVALFGFALWVNSRRAATLFRDGVATMGIVRRSTSPSDRRGSGYVMLSVEFMAADGRTRTAQVTTLAKKAEIDAREGAPIPVLYLPSDPGKVAAYTPALGLVVGLARG